MSQLAESQSAIIENENNSNIAMESQAALANEDSTRSEVEIIAAEKEQELSTRAEDEEKMEVEDEGESESAGDAALVAADVKELKTNDGNTVQLSAVTDDDAEMVGTAEDTSPQCQSATDGNIQSSLQEAEYVKQKDTVEWIQTDYVHVESGGEAEERSHYADTEIQESGQTEEEYSKNDDAHSEETSELVPEYSAAWMGEPNASVSGNEVSELQQDEQQQQAEAERKNERSLIEDKIPDKVDMSVDEDKLLADENVQSKEPAQDTNEAGDELQMMDDQSEVLDELALIEYESEFSEDVQEVRDGSCAETDQSRTKDYQQSDVEEAPLTDSAPNMVEDNSDSAKDPVFVDDKSAVVDEADEAIFEAPHVQSGADGLVDTVCMAITEPSATVQDTSEVEKDSSSNVTETPHEMLDNTEEKRTTEAVTSDEPCIDLTICVQGSPEVIAENAASEYGDNIKEEIQIRQTNEEENIDSGATQNITRPAEDVLADHPAQLDTTAAEEAVSDQVLSSDFSKASDSTVVHRKTEGESLIQSPSVNVKSEAEVESELVGKQAVETVVIDHSDIDTVHDHEAVESETAGKGSKGEIRNSTATDGPIEIIDSAAVEDTVGIIDSAACDEVEMVDSAEMNNAHPDTNTVQNVDSKSRETSNVHTTRSAPEEDDDVVVLDDDDDEPVVDMKLQESEKELFNSNNDMGIQIESVSGGAEELHKMAELNQGKQENEDEGITMKTEAKKENLQASSNPTKKVPSKMQTCIVCKRVTKCKYNIVRHGDVKHLCDDACFSGFRANPSLYLKGATPPSGGTSTAVKRSKATVKPGTGTPRPAAPAKIPDTSYKTCVVCLLMNVNSQGQFCTWKGMDFCGEGCLGKFQAGISTSCTLCKSFIPLTARSTNCLKLGNEIRPFCSARCYSDYKVRMRLCTFCKKDLASVQDSSFSAPVGSDGTFKDFCSQPCMKKYEDLLRSDVEIIKVEAGKHRGIKKCSVCQKNEVIKHAIKYNGTIHNLCSDPCLSAFRYANKLLMNTCDMCAKMCISAEPSAYTMVFEGNQKQFCSDNCLSKFRYSHRKNIPCSWCGCQCENFDMIERLDSNNKFQLFCSLNCLSLYRVNLQAKSNQSVTCDQCSKYMPAQYHLTMSDASVRNFCSYNCVMNFQAQFAKRTQPPAAGAIPPPPRHKHNTRGKASNRSIQEAAAAAASVPVISNVISLAPQGTQKTSKNSVVVPVVVSGTGSSPRTKTTSTGNQQAGSVVQQKVIIQPPPPKSVKNKSLMCRPFVQVKATSCRPHTQSKECQTDKVREKPAVIPVPVPVYLPTPLAMYTAPSPTPVFIPIPIPVPIFIPTTRRSADGIMKQIKEIQEKTPSDPLEAELLMMAAAVSGDGKNSSDSDSDSEMLPEINSGGKRRPARTGEADEDADVMPLTGGKETEGGEEDMISMALRMAEEMSGPISDLESSVEAVPINTEPPPPPPVPDTSEVTPRDEHLLRSRRGAKRGNSTRRSVGRPPKRPRVQESAAEQVIMRQEPALPPGPPADADCHLKFTYGVNAWRHWVIFKNTQVERSKLECGRVKLFKTDILQCTADELNFSLCLFVKEVRKPSGDEYSPDSIYYLTLGIQRYLFENGRIDNIFSDHFYERFTDCLTEILSKCQPKFNSSGQMVCRIEEEHLWECKQLGAHSPYVLLNTLVYFHTKYFMLKTPEDHMKLSFAHILKYWKKGQPSRGGQPTRSVSLRYYSVSTAKKDGSAPTSTTKKGSKEGIPVYEVTENQDNPLRCPVKLYEFYLSKCPESIKNRSDIFYPVPERSCVPDSPVWFSTMPISHAVMTKMLTRILLVREIQEAHLHAQPTFV